MSKRSSRILKGKQEPPRYYRSRSRLTCIFLLAIGIILLALYLVQSVLSLEIFNDSTAGIILAFAILFLGIGFVLYFFYCLFARLSAIADDIESGGESEG